MKTSPVLFAAAFLLLWLAGCTSMTPYRTVWPADEMDCSPNPSGGVTRDCGKNILEASRKPQYDLLFVEFDDQGLQYPDPRDYKGEGDSAAVIGEARQQINLVMKHLLKLRDAHQRLSIIVFIHGWKNNADAANDNVKSFRQILSAIALTEQVRPPAERRAVVGIYVGWRGLSATVEPFKELSFWDRKATALHVAQGSVRALFARLKGFQCGQNDPQSLDGCRVRATNQSPNVRLLLIGHSFGGLVLYNAIAEDLIDSVTYDLDRGSTPGAGAAGAQVNPVARFGDMVILLNPAFEATRYTPLYRATQRATTDAKYDHYQVPIFVSVTTDADTATGLAFPLGRVVNSIFEKTASSEEYEANTNTIGHMTRYITHSLVSTDTEACKCWSGSKAPAPAECKGPPATDEQRAEQIQRDVKLEMDNSRDFFRNKLEDHRKLPPGWERTFCGGTKLTHLKSAPDAQVWNDPNSLVWNITTDRGVMAGHNDILNPVLVGFVRQLYEDVTVVPEVFRESGPR